MDRRTLAWLGFRMTRTSRLRFAAGYWIYIFLQTRETADKKDFVFASRCWCKSCFSVPFGRCRQYCRRLKICTLSILKAKWTNGPGQEDYMATGRWEMLPSTAYIFMVPGNRIHNKTRRYLQSNQAAGKQPYSLLHCRLMRYRLGKVW